VKINKYNKKDGIIKMNRSNKCIHITHNDADAIGCALVTALMLPEYNFLDNTYFCPANKEKASDKLKEVLDNMTDYSPDLIIISDLSITEEMADMLEDIEKTWGTYIIGCDHHTSNTLNDKHPWFHVFTGDYKDPLCDNQEGPISAAYALLNILPLYIDNKENVYIDETTINYKKLYELARSISRYDTWMWKKFVNVPQPYDYKDDIIQVISSAYGNKETFRELLSLYEGYRENGCNPYSELVPDNFKDIYNIEIGKQKKSIKYIPTKAKVFEFFNGYITAVFFRGDDYSNACCEAIYNSSDKIDVVMVLYPENNQIGLRTNKDIYLPDLIKENGYDGGGHPQSAGATLTNEQFLEILCKFYNDRTITLDVYLNGAKKE
jgi:oligoribonuclease NrnB/cAMP/cGMP phosphodiesterase (DHH superfamily)